jgi:RNA polymerase sigma factor (sigma-70 family)
MDPSVAGPGPGRLQASAERDKLLLRRMAGGDGAAFAALFDHLAPRIMGVLVRLLSSRSLAEDVLQESFLHAWRHAGTYRPETGSPCSWLMAIARSRGIESFRREEARKRVERANECSNGCSRTQGSGQETGAALPLLGHRILIVDHDSDFLQAFGLVLEGLGAKVYEATSAGTALEALITRRPDLLISDLRMKGMDGFGLVEAIRALPESLGGRTPAIALSGAPASEVVARVLSSGFQVFLQKPLNENELLLAVPALVGSSHSQGA